MEVSKEWIAEADALDALIGAGAANLAAAEYEWLIQIAEFDRKQAYLRWEFPTSAAWLAWRVGLDRRTAREKVRVANALVEFREIGAAMASGQLSYAKARAITRIVTRETETMLVELARDASSNQLDRVVATYRRVDKKNHERQRERRGFHYLVDDDGSMLFTVRLTPADGATFLAAVDANVDDNRYEDFSVRRADALVAMIDAKQGAPANVTLHIEQDALAVSAPMLPTPIALSAEAARRVACDCVIETVVEQDGQPVAIGRRQRLVTGRLRRALHYRDRCCRFPGCGRRGWMHAHHLRHWIDGGATNLANTTLLCSQHHAAVHEGGWAIDGDANGELVFVAPDERQIRAVPPLTSGDSRSVHRHGRDSGGIGSRDGGRLDLNHALTSLFYPPPLDEAA
ncbi:MAG: DUF222 domain-containing protein [Acidimicrobiia bacterium]